jgi:ribosomal protein S18 acetylase RimI-like enzyme
MALFVIITPMNIEVRKAVKKDFSALAKVLSEATLHKSKYGDFLWGTQPYATEEIEKKYQNGNLYTVLLDDNIVGTVAITESDKRVWGDSGSDEALYIHGLATSDEVRGQGVGSRVIEWVVHKAEKEGRRAVRLDCGYSNQPLCDYYKKEGFKEQRRLDIPRKSSARDLRDPIYKVALFQRSLS